MLGRHRRGEQVVDPPEYRFHGAEVGDQLDGLAVAEPVAGRKEQTDVGSPKSLDRLLGVADEEQATRLDLQLVPVADLVGVRADRRGDQGREVNL